MTPEEIIAMAKEAGMVVVDNKFSLAPFLARFAALVAEKAAAKEREACADIVENADTPDCGGWTAQGIADAIRSRASKGEA
jgi:hypothetical protein